MALRLSEIRELFDQECRFPTERATVIDRLGDTAIESSSGDQVRVETVLRRSEQSRYGSVAELHETLMANLGDAHVGRTDYDDRSGNPRRETDVSF